MYHPKTRWELAHTETQHAEELAREIGVHPIIATLLILRGIDTKDKASRFLNISADDFFDPFQLYGMERAVSRIRQAMERNEKIRIYGDYDADGVTSTSVMIETFRLLGTNVDFYIPNRFTEGYGLHEEGLKSAVDEGVSLMITVDTGITAVAEAELARSLGLDLIITDHHEPPAVLPDCVAVINPKQPVCDYPETTLAGVGVAFKLAHALLGRVPEELLPLAALGTVADLVPLVGENRLLTTLGLERINRKQHTGITALLQVAGLAEREVTSGHIGFALGPRLNAGGRLDTAEPAVHLLTSRDHEQARLLAEKLDKMNKERQHVVDALTEQAMAQVAANADDFRYAIVVANPDWHIGVIGIVASRLVERFYRPTVVLGIDEATGLAKGSARSIAGFDIYRALSELKGLLSHFGGHPMAAGMTMAAADIDTFRKKLNAIAAAWLSEDDFKPVTSVDLRCSLDMINMDWVEQLALLEPFGVGNPTPRFHIVNTRLQQLRRMGKERDHVKLTLSSGERKLHAVGFRMGEVADGVTVGSDLEVVGELQINEWNGNRSTQLVMADVTVPHLQVFDWRGYQMTDAMWEKLARQNVVFIIFNEETIKKLPSQLRYSDHVITAWQQPLPISTPVCHSPYLAVVDYPIDLQCYREWLRYFSQLERVYFLGEVEEAFYTVPKHEQFKQLYAFLHHYQVVADLDKLAHRLGLPVAVVMFMIDVFEELNFIERHSGEVKVKANPPKRPLNESQLLQRRKRGAEVYQMFYYASSRELADDIMKVRTVEPVH